MRPLMNALLQQVFIVARCLLALALFSACSRATPPAEAPTQAEPRPVGSTASTAQPGRDSEPLDVPPPPASCEPLAVEAGTTKGACPSERAAALSALATALESENVAERDRALVALEDCAPYGPGVIRALRAELGPAECRDAILGDWVRTHGKTADREVRDLLSGLALAGQLSRLVRDPPRLAPPIDKPRFERFFKEELLTWITRQAHAIHVLALQGSRLRGYGQGIVAVEAGLADMRFVEMVRSVPIPAELESDPQLKDAYYGSLDQALEPRKTRGRDAALVGLRRFAELGVLHDARVEQARSLLSMLYGGRRIDALDGLLLPELPALDVKTPERRLAAVLPTFYSDRLLRHTDPTKPPELRAFLARGLPPFLLAKLRAGGLSAESLRLAAHGLIRLGQRYWRAQDFAAAAEILRGPATAAARDEEAVFLLALSRVLAAGPKDAAEMMLRGPQHPADIGDVAQLDEAGKSKGRSGGLAAYDAAYVLRLVPPMENDAAFWTDLARRFRAAAPRLPRGDARRAAEESAAAADRTAKAIQAAPRRP